MYEKLSRLPKNRVEAALQHLKKLPENSPLLKIPKEHICQAFLPAGFDLHGNTTNNMAEVLNKMLMPARESNTLLDALLQTVRMLHVRHVHLYDEMLKLKKDGLGVHTAHAQGRPMPAGAILPRVMEEHRLQQKLAEGLMPACKRSGPTNVSLWQPSD